MIINRITFQLLALFLRTAIKMSDSESEEDSRLKEAVDSSILHSKLYNEREKRLSPEDDPSPVHRKVMKR